MNAPEKVQLNAAGMSTEVARLQEALQDQPVESPLVGDSRTRKNEPFSCVNSEAAIRNSRASVIK